MLTLRRFPVAILFALLVGCGGNENIPDTRPARGPGDPSQLIRGKWKHTGGKLIVKLHFEESLVHWSRKEDGVGPSGKGAYEILNAQLLELPKIDDRGDEEEVTIDTLTADKLVLSGGDSWKFARTEFSRDK